MQRSVSGNLAHPFVKENWVLEEQSNSNQLMVYPMFVLMTTAYANSINHTVKREFGEKRRHGESLRDVLLIPMVSNQRWRNYSCAISKHFLCVTRI